jgi:hypothetical protein
VLACNGGLHLESRRWPPLGRPRTATMVARVSLARARAPAEESCARKQIARSATLDLDLAADDGIAVPAEFP